MAGLPDKTAFMPKTENPRFPANRRVVSLVYDGLCTFEFGITAEVFGLDRPEAGPDWYQFKSVSLEDRPLHACGGLTIAATGTETDLYQAGTIIVPGWRGPDEPVPEQICKALLRAHEGGARVVSICGGAMCWRPPVCSMAVAPQRIGVLPRAWPGAIPLSRLTRIASISMRVTYSPRQAAQRASIFACISSVRISGLILPIPWRVVW